MPGTLTLTGVLKSFREKLFGYDYQVLEGHSSDLVRSSKTRRTRIYLTAAFCLFAPLLLIYQFSRAPARAEQQQLAEQSLQTNDGPYVRYRQGPHWHGWSNITHLIVFGDSWSTTSFRPQEAPPSAENPFGNPQWPGETATNGANWVDYLTYEYNESLVLTADYAVGGATVDERILPPGTPHAGGLRGLRTQVEQEFAASYENSSLYDWKPDSSLFVIWIGINDVHEADNSTRYLFPTIIREYAEYADYLYQTGARNFMFMTVPPIERAPIAAGKYEYYHRLVTNWNVNITQLAWNLTATYDDTTTLVFDAHEFLDDVIDDPCTVPESCGLKETIEFCMQYTFGLYHDDPSCPYTIDEYLWMNPLHPTTVTHHAIARAVSDALRAPDAVT